ncbi:hypothetical protein ACIQM4_34500 [Streptomyces sp. NPDC091272]|uniref:hypothetical protein n=1 Tax=Streptomyces sp. NPDC091272 TaxID=3365981 RepID=UPI00381A55EE
MQHEIQAAADTGGTTQWINSVGAWIVEHAPASQEGWWVVLAAVGVLIGVCMGMGAKHLKDTGRKEKAGLDGAVETFFEGVAVLVGQAFGAVGRWFSGAPMWGEPRSAATWWRPGPLLDLDAPAAELGSVAVAGTLWEPYDWAAARKRITACLPEWAAWTAPVATTLGRALEGLVRAVGTLWRGMRAWHQWRRAGRATARTGLSLFVAFAVLAPMAALGVVAIAIPTAILSAALWGDGYEYDFDQIHGETLWQAVRPLLRLDDDTDQSKWLTLPRDADADGAAIVLRLPMTLLGTPADREHVQEALEAVVPGEWEAAWETTGRRRHVRWTQAPSGDGADAEYGPGLWEGLRVLLKVPGGSARADWLHISPELDESTQISIRVPRGWLGTPEQLDFLVNQRMPGEWIMRADLVGANSVVHWTPKPPPAPKPQLPTMVEWIPSDDPARVYIGEVHTGPKYIDTTTETPHWGISGGTGDGKTTGLLMPVVHGRQHGALIDCITMKANAFKDIEGESGIRVHKTGRQAVAAMAEFYVSMKAAEALQGTPEGDALPERFLVIDEFASFVKSAKIWWKYGLQGKGMPPFEAWFQMILMQGRSANHKIVIGAHTFTLSLFGDTETRDLIGAKGIVGAASGPKWAVTYGQETPRVEWDHTVKGRGVIGVTGGQVEEIQYAYITPFAREYLRDCAPAAAWHARGEMAPWIDDHALSEAAQELAITPFLAGGAYMQGVTLVTGAVIPAPKIGKPRSELVTSQAGTAAVTDPVTEHYEHQADQDESASLPHYSLREACEQGLIPVSYAAARQRIARGRKNGVQFPEGIDVEGVTCYTAAELADWWTLVSTIKKKSSKPSM